ncbi:MAG: aminoacyl-tRNA hydrolase [candidate division NC10 bacterium]|nr:aminoacyl-tRNA hydrolase [candidate division NC10 bacterium]MDE2320957.1 aminoacyl-tRNA hydrolase [candidate division NC10 bacterium]
MGLGNPGPDYEVSRHNVGFRVVDTLADRVGVALKRCRYRSLFVRGALHGIQILLVKPLTFMNESGFSVSGWQQALHLEPGRIIVVHDDLDLPPSQLRIRAGGGHGGHGGVRSIIEAMGSSDFLRVRVGIGRPRDGQDAVKHVLGPFEECEDDMIQVAIQRAADAVELLLQEGFEAAMNRYNIRGARQARMAQSGGGEKSEPV